MIQRAKKMMSGYWKFVDAQIPKVELEEKHISNAKLILTREKLLELLPKGGTVAELGVDNGDFSQKILSINQPEKLYLVDFWGSKRYNKDKQNAVYKRFELELSSNKVEIALGLSTDVVTHFSEHQFDWIYIDTDHSYTTTRDELESYRTKIKPGGFIAGHDFRIGNWNGQSRYGVIEAVYEFCAKYDWEIVYITCENEEFPSFAIKHIAESNT